MGIVYKARDPKIDRLVAIKTISLLTQGPEEDREFRERLFTEARAAGRLSHPGIVTVFDVGEEESASIPYIVMEYVAGSSLEWEVSQRADRFPLATTLALVEQVAEALDYAHSQGIVHRDIKPANILLPENGPPKITDFGIAKFGFGHQAALNEALGTPAFMSPEQLNGEPVDGRSDLFSLGVVLYTLLTGYRPFQGNSALTVSFKVVNRNPLPATAFDSAFPPEIDSIVQRCMAKDPGDRYQTGKDMAAALRELREIAEHSSERRESSFDAVYGTPSAHLIQGSPMASASVRASRVPVQQTLHWPSWQYAAAVVLTFAVFGFAFILFRNTMNPPPVPTPVILSSAATNTSVSKPHDQSGQQRNMESNASVGFQGKPSRQSKRRTHGPAAGKSSRQAAAKLQAASTPVLASPTTSSATLRLRVEDRLSQAEVILWIDDKLAYDQTVGGVVKKRMVVFKGVEGYQSDSLQILSGDHRFRVRVHSGDNSYDQTAVISGTLPSQAERLLFIQCEKKKPLRLTLQ